MPEMRLTIGVLALALVLITLQGPLAMLRDLPSGALSDGGYWRDVAETAIRSAADGGIALIGVIAAALGIPLARAARAKGSEGPPG